MDNKKVEMIRPKLLKQRCVLVDFASCLIQLNPVFASLLKSIKNKNILMMG